MASAKDFAALQSNRTLPDYCGCCKKKPEESAPEPPVEIPPPKIQRQRYPNGEPRATEPFSCPENCIDPEWSCYQKNSRGKECCLPCTLLVGYDPRKDPKFCATREESGCCTPCVQVKRYAMNQVLTFTFTEPTKWVVPEGIFWIRFAVIGGGGGGGDGGDGGENAVAKGGFGGGGGSGSSGDKKISFLQVTPRSLLFFFPGEPGCSTEDGKATIVYFGGCPIILVNGGVAGDDGDDGGDAVDAVPGSGGRGGDGAPSVGVNSTPGNGGDGGVNGDLTVFADPGLGGAGFGSCPAGKPGDTGSIPAEGGDGKRGAGSGGNGGGPDQKGERGRHGTRGKIQIWY